MYSSAPGTRTSDQTGAGESPDGNSQRDFYRKRNWWSVEILTFKKTNLSVWLIKLINTNKKNGDFYVVALTWHHIDKLIIHTFSISILFIFYSYVTCRLAILNSVVTIVEPFSNIICKYSTLFWKCKPKSLLIFVQNIWNLETYLLIKSNTITMALTCTWYPRQNDKAISIQELFNYV